MFGSEVAVTSFALTVAVGWTATAVASVVAMAVVVSSGVIVAGIVEAVAGSEVGVTAVSGLAVQAANKEKKHPQINIMRAMRGVEHI
jgi:hypothetical protein